MVKLRDAETVHTAPVVGLGLIGGWLTARESGIRPLGGVVLGLCGALAFRTWLEKGGIIRAGGLLAGYLAAFGLSHPLAKKIGPWPAVLSVTAASAAAAHIVSDRED